LVVVADDFAAGADLEIAAGLAASFKAAGFTTPGAGML
jgi:hypothetical protein